MLTVNFFCDLHVVWIEKVAWIKEPCTFIVLVSLQLRKAMTLRIRGRRSALESLRTHTCATVARCGSSEKKLDPMISSCQSHRYQLFTRLADGRREDDFATIE
jgi:hypothetical protein